MRVVVQSMGGGFGSKAGAQRVVHYAARLAMLAGRPVRLELTRPEEFMSHPRRYAGEVTMRLGAKRDGTLTALDAEIVLDIGSGSLYAGRYTMTLHQISELYRCPNVRVRIVAVYTNTGPTGPQRGVLDPIATFSTEAAIDDLAARLGMDPLALRLKNYAPDFQGLDDTTPPPALHLQAPRRVPGHGGGGDRLGGPRPQARRPRRGPVRRGVGMAAYCIERGGYAPFSAKADVVARPDGAVEVQAGVVEIGAGQITVLPMIAAEELGLPAERINIHHGDTDGTHYAPSSHASRITSEVGPAVLQAASQVRQRLCELAAERLEVSPHDLVAAGRAHPRARRGRARHDLRGRVRAHARARDPRHRQPRAQSGRRDLPPLRRPRRRGGSGHRDRRGAGAPHRVLARHRPAHQPEAGRVAAVRRRGDGPRLRPLRGGGDGPARAACC